MVEFARGADVLLVEATLSDAAEDDVERGHLTAAEAIDLARDAQVGAALLVHYPPDRRRGTGSPVRGGRPVDPAGRPRAEPDGRAEVEVGAGAALSPAARP